MNINEAIQRFRTAAIQKRDFAQAAAEDHRLHRDMATAWRELHNQGIAGRDAFKKLLADESKYVRGWVAAQLLSEGDRDAVPVLIAWRLGAQPANMRASQYPTSSARPPQK
jgi:hypothetical protein